MPVQPDGPWLKNPINHLPPDKSQSCRRADLSWSDLPKLVGKQMQTVIGVPCLGLAVLGLKRSQNMNTKKGTSRPFARKFCKLIQLLM